MPNGDDANRDGTADKKVGTSSYATGGGGTVLEHRYGAVILAALLLENSIPGLDDAYKVERVKFQASAESAVDDFLVIGVADADQGRHPRTLSIAVRRSPNIAPSDKKFVELLASCVRTYNDNLSAFKDCTHRLCIVVASPHAGAQETAILAEQARAAASSKEFYSTVRGPGRASAELKKRLEHFLNAISAAETGRLEPELCDPSELSWRILRSLWVHQCRLEEDDGDRTSCVQRLCTIVGSTSKADALFDTLCAIASKSARTSATVDRATLCQLLKGRLDMSGPPFFASARLSITTGRVQEIRVLLENVVTDVGDIQKLAEAAGLTTDRTDFGSGVSGAWHAVLTAAWQSGRLPELLDVLRLDYPRSGLIQHLYSEMVNGQPVPAAEFGDNRTAVERYRVTLMQEFDLVPSDSMTLLLTHSWETAGAQVIRLEDLFASPRVVPAGNGSASEFALGSPKDIVLKRHAVVQGGAGAGKTIWLRLLMMQLLNDNSYLPVYIPINRLLDTSSAITRRARGSVYDAVLEEIAAHADLERREIELLFVDEHFPRPVLLVDGLECTGVAFDELRAALRRFAAECPRACIVVTCRRIDLASAEVIPGFSAYNVLPLSDAEIAEHIRRYLIHCRRESPDAAAWAAPRRASTMLATPGDASLVRRPLFLAIALALPQVEPGVTRHHSLYQQCVEHLLSSSPTPAPSSSTPPPIWWAPGSGDERLKLSSGLAAAALDSLARDHTRLACWRPDELARFVPETSSLSAGAALTRMQRAAGFVRWSVTHGGLLAAGPAGLSFSHSCFLEILAAHSIVQTIETRHGDPRPLAERASSTVWNDALVLALHLYSDTHPETTQQLLERLVQGDASTFWLVGAACAEGLGDGSIFGCWLARLAWAMEQPATSLQMHCAVSWMTTKQAVRRQEFVSALQALEADATRRSRQGLDAIHRILALRHPAVSRPLPRTALLRAVALAEDPQCRDLSAEVIAVERTSPSRAYARPSNGWWEVSLLHLWPSQRREIGARLQLAVMCGAEISDLRLLAHYLGLCAARSRIVSEDLQRKHRNLVSVVEGFIVAIGLLPSGGAVFEITRSLAEALARELISAFECCTRYAPAGTTMLGVIDRLCEYSGDRLVSTILGLQRGQPMTDLFRIIDVDKELWSPEPWRAALGYRDTPTWLVDFASTGACYFGRPVIRPLLGTSIAALMNIGDDPVLALLCAACRASLSPSNRSARDDFEEIARNSRVAITPDGSLWLALARVVARRSTDSDRDILEHLARRSSPLLSSKVRHALRYIVRGDVLLGDGTIVALEDLAPGALLDSIRWVDDYPAEISE